MIYFFLIAYVIMTLGLSLLFKKADLPIWKALVPGLNFVIWCKLIGRSAWWSALLLIPIVNIFIYVGMSIDLVRSFGRLKFIDSLLAVIINPFYLIWIGNNAQDRYQGPILAEEKAYSNKLKLARVKGKSLQYAKLIQKNPYQKSKAREWAESMVFAVFAAAFIRMFVIEAFAIPTSSMEGTLKVGDCLFVSKVHYGLRMPQTVAMLPLIHNRIPVLNSKSYLEKPSLAYKRLPGLEKIDVLDKIVFNWPVGDSVLVTPDRIWNIEQARRFEQVKQLTRGVKLTTHPTDKKEFYVKRCLAAPGDTFAIVDRKIIVNGKHIADPKHVQFKYRITSPTGRINLKMLDKIGVSLEDSPYPANSYHLNLEQVEQIRKSDPSLQIELLPQDSKGALFPNDNRHFGHWTTDNFGPIIIPKKGITVDISKDNIALYRRVISAYENNDLVIRGDQIYINGQKANTYTFQMDYYWGVGDNRHNSEDSRSWGFIPEDHIVGKPLFLHFSMKNGSLRNGVNWDRIFKNISGQD